MEVAVSLTRSASVLKLWGYIIKIILLNHMDLTCFYGWMGNATFKVLASWKLYRAVVPGHSGEINVCFHWPGWPPLYFLYVLAWLFRGEFCSTQISKCEPSWDSVVSVVAMLSPGSCWTALLHEWKCARYTCSLLQYQQYILCCAPRRS